MNSRPLFKKRKLNRKLIISFFSLIIIFILFYFSFFTNENKFIVIPENNDVFYIIPEDRGGEKVPNLDKKSLNLISKKITEKEIVKPDDLLFSIQFFSDSEISNVNKYLKKLTSFDESIYNIDNFYIVAFKSEIGIEYFLLYKNFNNRLDAKDYCINFLPKMDKCLIIDTTKF